jgi:hypothetical protein
LALRIDDDLRWGSLATVARKVTARGFEIVKAHHELPQVIATLSESRRFAGGLNRRQQKRYEQSDNRDDD